MNRLALVALVVAGALAFVSGCSALTSFDPEGQPCDANAAVDQQCLSDAGYRCANGVCTRFADAGP